jgi:hypothetical protein
MSWFDWMLIGAIIWVIYWAKQMSSLKEEASPDNETLADELSQLDARVAKQRIRLRMLKKGEL